MTSLLIFCATILLLSISATQAGEFYQPVEGKCSELPELKEYDYKKMASGEWYFPYISFGSDGDKCASGHAIARGNNTYIDLLFYDTKNSRYLKVPDDVTYLPEKPGVYTSDTGMTAHIVSAELENYLFSVQCIEAEGKTTVLTLMGTRSRDVDEKTEQIYKDVTAMLKKKKLLPPMRSIPQTDCPPLTNIVHLG